MDRILEYIAMYYWFGILLIWRVKQLKYEELGEDIRVGFRDFYWFFILSVAMGSGLSLERSWLNGVLFGMTGILFVGLWLDAIVMNQFSAQINRHALRIYFSNTAQMNAETAHAWRNVLRKPLLAVFPLVSLAFYFCFILRCYTGLYFVLPIMAAYCLGNPSHPKAWLVPASAALLTVAAAPMFLTSPHLPDVPLHRAIPAGITVITAGILLPLRIGLNKLSGRFFQAPSYLDQFMSCGAPLINHTVPFTKADRRIIDIPLLRQRTSDWHNRFSGAHVILVALESISPCQVAYYSGRGARMPVFENLAGRGLSSKRHFCISPNSNNSLVALYNGNYRNQLTFPHLQTLHAQGYQSVVIVPADSAGFGMDQLLHQIGFQHVIDLNCFPEYRIPNDQDRRNLVHFVDDERFYELALTRLSQIRRPGTKLFLHITNSQTHFPYETHMQPANADAGIRYIQAIEEADLCLGHFLLGLDDLIPLTNTMMVYTADHGESLGERGYKAHSTAITREQINVPFAIHHPAMPHLEVPFSTHFDVFPTLFDFLGIQYDYPAIGSSLRLPNRALNEVLFSETRHGATPSCYGHVGATTKLFFDVSLNRYQVMDWDDQIVKDLSGAEQDRCQALLFAALQTRGLVSGGTSSSKVKAALAQIASPKSNLL